MRKSHIRASHDGTVLFHTHTHTHTLAHVIRINLTYLIYNKLFNTIDKYFYNLKVIII